MGGLFICGSLPASLVETTSPSFVSKTNSMDLFADSLNLILTVLSLKKS